MLRSYQATTGKCPAKGPNGRPLTVEERSGAFGTGSWTDTSPRFGCCTATTVAMRELVANAADRHFFVHCAPLASTLGSRMGTC